MTRTTDGMIDFGYESALNILGLHGVDCMSNVMDDIVESLTDEYLARFSEEMNERLAERYSGEYYFKLAAGAIYKHTEDGDAMVDMNENSPEQAEMEALENEVEADLDNSDWEVLALFTQSW